MPGEDVWVAQVAQETKLFYTHAYAGIMDCHATYATCPSHSRFGSRRGATS